MKTAPTARLPTSCARCRARHAGRKTPAGSTAVLRVHESDIVCRPASPSPRPFLLDLPPLALSLRRGFFRYNLQHPLLAVADDGHSRLHTDTFFDKEPMQVIDAGRRRLPIAHDDIAFPQARTLRRAVPFDGDDLDAALDRQVVRQRETARQRHVLPAHADEAAPDLAV